MTIIELARRRARHAMNWLRGRRCRTALITIDPWVRPSLLGIVGTVERTCERADDHPGRCRDHRGEFDKLVTFFGKTARIGCDENCAQARWREGRS